MSLWKPAESGKENTKLKLPNLSRQQWVVILLLGLLLAVAALPVSNKQDKETESILRENTEPADVPGQTELEEKLEALLSEVEGVGKVQVVLMTGEGEDSLGFSSKNTTRVTGVLIAAQGADNSVTVQNIQQAVMALFQVEAHKIKVMKMK